MNDADIFQENMRESYDRLGLALVLYPSAWDRRARDEARARLDQLVNARGDRLAAVPAVRHPIGLDSWIAGCGLDGGLVLTCATIWPSTPGVSSTA